MRNSKYASITKVIRPLKIKFFLRFVTNFRILLSSLVKSEITALTIRITNAKNYKRMYTLRELSEVIDI